MLLYSSGFQAQSKSELEDMAYDYLNNYEFPKAYDAFEKLVTRYPKEPDYKFKLGICALSHPEKKEKAIQIFKRLQKKITHVKLNIISPELIMLIINSMMPLEFLNH